MPSPRATTTAPSRTGRADSVEMLRIIHRVQDGVVSERLASLDGSGREFIRTGANLACYLPDQRTVLVEQRPPQEPLVGFPAVNDQTASFYDIRKSRARAYNRRDTHVITVSPKDEYRYGYRLWIDDSTAMPLKTQLCDAHGHVIEQIVFASLTLSSRIPDAAFKPDVSTDGFQWLRNDAAAAAAADGRGAGLERRDAAARIPHDGALGADAAGLARPVDHLVFTDGLASVSVFVETQTGGRRAEHRGVRRRRLFVGVLDHGRRPQGHRRRRGAAADRQVHRLAGARAGACAGSAPGAAERVSAARLTVVHRHDCQLCDEMLAELDRPRPHSCALPPIDVVDVDCRSRALRRHGLDVPVLLLDGTVVCRHRLDRGELRAAAAVRPRRARERGHASP